MHVSSKDLRAVHGGGGVGAGRALAQQPHHVAGQVDGGQEGIRIVQKIKY